MSDLTRVKDFAPGRYDTKGLALPHRQDWVVCPIMRTRDDGAEQEGLFASALERLGGESDTVEVHRFRHPGLVWFEVIIVHPGGA